MVERNKVTAEAIHNLTMSVGKQIAEQVLAQPPPLFFRLADRSYPQRRHGPTNPYVNIPGVELRVQDGKVYCVGEGYEVEGAYPNPDELRDLAEFATWAADWLERRED